MKVTAGRGGRVLKWLDKQILTNDSFPEDTVWIALMKEDDSIVGAVCFTDYRGSTVNMHVAGCRKGWVTRNFIRANFEYAFNQLKVNTVLGLVRVDNPRALLFDTRLGFKVVGTIPKGDDDGTDFYLLAMTKDECRWIKKAGIGKE